MSDNILEVSELITAFDTDRGLVRAVDRVSFSVPRGKTLGIVGESGCGKSVTAMSIIQLLPQPAGRVLQGVVSFKGRDLTRVSAKEMRKIRGGEIGVIFQEPMTALNPVHRIGRQLSECFLLHKKMSKKEAWEASIEMLRLVRIPAPEQRIGDYPHQLSGGMRQRVVIAMALACRPDLVIADEPTTALDVTVQAQILDLMKRLQEEMGMSLVLITHDLGVIAESCDEVVVMYAGRVVERAPVKELFANPLHAYTKGLLASIPRLETEPKSVLPVIPGMVASITDFVPGCRFCQRMERRGPTLRERPDFREVAPGHWVETCPSCFEEDSAKEVTR
jgi:oligopeptide/dipeptide ABC transporter ATP-binding protein